MLWAENIILCDDQGARSHTVVVMVVGSGAPNTSIKKHFVSNIMLDCNFLTVKISPGSWRYTSSGVVLVEHFQLFLG